MDKNVDVIICKFADDTKINGIVNNEEGCPRLQWDEIDNTGRTAAFDMPTFIGQGIEYRSRDVML